MKQGQYSWQYYHTENAWPVTHAFCVNSTDLNETPVLKQKLLEIAGVEHNNHLRGGIVNIVNQTDTSWLVAMKKLGYRYACIWFDGCWPSNHDFNMALLNEIDRINDEFGFDNWMIAGNIEVEEDRYAHFTRNIIIVNIQKWQDLGEPDPSEVHFNQPVWGHHSRYVLNQEDPVEEIWDLYSGQIVEGYEDSAYGIRRFGPIMEKLRELVYPEPEMPDWQFNQRYQEKFANSLLTYALRQEVYVPGLSTEFMDHLTLLRPHIGSHELEKAIQGLPYDETKISFQANRVVKNIFAPDSPIYFVNTEPSQPETAEQIENTGFDQYVGATAGFKLFYYAHKYGFDTNTKFILYDFDPLSCKFKQDLLTDWNGKNLPAFIESWVANNPGANTALQGLATERWPRVVDQFGGETAWLETWNKIKQSQWQVVECDLIYGHDKLFDLLDNQRTFMWTSNIYSYIIPKMLSKPFKLEESFISMITKLSSLDDDCWFSGTDINDNDLMCPASAIISTTNNESIGFEQ
jgi:hypothetical protein